MRYVRAHRLGKKCLAEKTGFKEADCARKKRKEWNTNFPRVGKLIFWPPNWATTNSTHGDPIPKQTLERLQKSKDSIFPVRLPELLGELSILRITRNNLQADPVAENIHIAFPNTDS